MFAFAVRKIDVKKPKQVIYVRLAILWGAHCQIKKFISMRKSTLLFIALILSASVFAQKSLRIPERQKSLSTTLPAPQVKAQAMSRLGGVPSGQPQRASKPARVRAKADVAGAELVTGQPEGREVVYNKAATAWYVYWYTVFSYQAEEGVGRLVFDDATSTVWFKNPLASLATQTWLKGSLEGNTITVKTPQYIYSEEYYGETYDYYIKVLVYDENEQSYVVDTETDEIQFEIQEDGSIVQTSDGKLLGLVDDEDYWMGYGDEAIVYTPFTAATVEEPSGLDYEKWAFVYGDDGHFVDVSFSGSDVYVKGLYQNLPDAVVRGTVLGNKAVFDSRQYLGADEQTLYHVYFFGSTADVEIIEDEEYGDYEQTTYSPTEALTFGYDAGSKVLVAESYLLLNAGQNSANPIYAYDSPVIRFQTGETARPANPVFDYFFPYDESYGYGYMEFTLPKFDVNGRLLDASRIYYNIYYDDEVVTFYPDEYTEIDEEMTDVPYDFSDDWDFYVYGVTHGVYIYATGFERVGVQALYKDGETVLASDIVYYGEDTAVERLESVAQPVREVFTDLAGRTLARPAKGLNVKTVTYADGTSRSYKLVVR